MFLRAKVGFLRSLTTQSEILSGENETCTQFPPLKSEEATRKSEVFAPVAREVESKLGAAEIEESVIQFGVCSIRK
jgi:hypothetical protein